MTGREEIILDEALADAGCWKGEARRLEAVNAELLDALEDVMAEADFGDAALEAKCRAAIAKAKGNL